MPSNCGIFIGASSSDFAQKAFSELKDPNAYLMAGTNSSALSGRLAHFLQTNGPCLTVDTGIILLSSVTAITIFYHYRGNTNY
jgi:acyl transferase domain-containing protein